MDTQWRHNSKISEKLGRQNMLRPYLKIWDWDWIFGRAVKAIFSLGVRSPCETPCNVCFKKTWTNYSTVSLLWLFQVFLKQTLFGTKNCDSQVRNWQYRYVNTVLSRFKKAWFKKESRFKKAWYKKESRFKKDCNYNRFLVHKLFDLRKIF